MPGWHEDIHEHPPIERNDEAHAVVVAVVAADEERVAAIEDPDDAPLDAAPLLDALDPGNDPVAVHGLVEMRARHVNVAAALEGPLGHHEPVPGRMRFETPDVEIHFF